MNSAELSQRAQSLVEEWEESQLGRTTQSWDCRTDVYTFPFKYSDLSVDAQKLCYLLDGEQGDTNLLPRFAAREKFNLEAALNELRTYGVLDETSPSIIKFKRSKI